MTSSNPPPRPKVHNPGSAEALKQGCTCSPKLNNWGAGKPINEGRNRAFTAALDCALHNSFFRKNAN